MKQSLWLLLVGLISLGAAEKGKHAINKKLIVSNKVRIASLLYDNTPFITTDKQKINISTEELKKLPLLEMLARHNKVVELKYPLATYKNLEILRNIIRTIPSDVFKEGLLTPKLESKILDEIRRNAQCNAIDCFNVLVLAHYLTINDAIIKGLVTYVSQSMTEDDIDYIKENKNSIPPPIRDALMSYDYNKPIIWHVGEHDVKQEGLMINFLHSIDFTQDGKSLLGTINDWSFWGVRTKREPIILKNRNEIMFCGIYESGGDAIKVISSDHYLIVKDWRNYLADTFIRDINSNKTIQTLKKTGTVFTIKNKGQLLYTGYQGREEQRPLFLWRKLEDRYEIFNGWIKKWTLNENDFILDQEIKFNRNTDPHFDSLSVDAKKNQIYLFGNGSAYKVDKAGKEIHQLKGKFKRIFSDDDTYSANIKFNTLLGEDIVGCCIKKNNIDIIKFAIQNDSFKNEKYHGHSINSFFFSPQNRFFIIKAGRNLYIYDLHLKKIILTVDNTDAVCFSPDERYCAVRTKNKIKIWLMLNPVKEKLLAALNPLNDTQKNFGALLLDQKKNEKSTSFRIREEK